MIKSNQEISEYRLAEFTGTYRKQTLSCPAKDCVSLSITGNNTRLCSTAVYLVHWLQVAAVFAGQVLLGQLELELPLSVSLPGAATKSGHLQTIFMSLQHMSLQHMSLHAHLVCRQLPHVLLHPGGGQPRRRPAVPLAHHLN